MLLILNKRKGKKINKRKPKIKNKTHAEIEKQKDLTKSKLNRFYVTIKLGINMVIFQQQISGKSFSISTRCEITLTGERLDILIFIEPFDTQ